MDYCSQLYFTGEASDLSKIENLQRTFTKKIYKMDNLNYWERIKLLKLNSQERRMERYRIIYTWKTIEGLVPNCGIKVHTNERRGRFCEIPPINGRATQRLKTLREKSFNIHGPKLFNALPCSIRNTSKCSIEEFKMKLDQWLVNIPDQPRTPTLVPEALDQFTAKASNTIIDQARRFKQNAGG